MADDANDDKDEKPKKVYPNLRPAWTKEDRPTGGRTPRYIKHADVVAKVADNVEEAIDVVKQIMRKTRISPGDEIRLRAANSIIDRILGKAPQSMAASFVHRTISADGTVIEGSGPAASAMSPLLQAAHAHLAQEEVRRLTPPAPTANDSSSRPNYVSPPAQAAPPDDIIMPPPASVQILDEVPAPASAADQQPATPAPAPAAEGPADREKRLAELRKQYPGGQLPREVLFGEPDPPGQSIQGPLETVTLTRGPGKSIERV